MMTLKIALGFYYWSRFKTFYLFKTYVVCCKKLCYVIITALWLRAQSLGPDFLDANPNSVIY